MFKFASQDLGEEKTLFDGLFTIESRIDMNGLSFSQANASHVAILNASVMISEPSNKNQFVVCNSNKSSSSHVDMNCGNSVATFPSVFQFVEK